MRPVTGTQKMQMRFELLSKSGPGASFVELPGTGLDSWISPADPTLGQRPGDVWIVPDLVRNLPAPAVYQYRVSFRWTGTGGQVLATETRSTRNCHQPMFRPDLLVSSIAIEPIPDKPARDTYVATIENDGNAPAAGPFSVTFTPAASATPGVTPVTTTKTIQRLDVGASDEVTFGGPACTAATAPTVVVDPGDTVAESDFTNNSLAVDPSCPALTSAPTPTSTSGS
jgi:CARDB